MMFLKKLNDRKFATNFVSFDFVKKLKNQLTIVMIKNDQIFSNFAVSKNKKSFDTKSMFWKTIFYKFIERSKNQFFSNVKNFSIAIEFEIITIITNVVSTLEKKYRILSKWIDENVAIVSIVIDFFVSFFDEIDIKTIVIENNAQNLIKIFSRKRFVKTKKIKNAITKKMMLKKFSIIKSIENDIIFVNESSQFSQINYSSKKFQIISNTFVKNTKKKHIFKQTIAMNSFSHRIFMQQISFKFKF